MMSYHEMILKLFSILLILGSGRASGSNLGACRTNGAPLSSGYRYQHFHGVSNEVHPAPDLFDELPPICALPRRASIEYCVFTSTKFAGGRGISVLARREHTDNILNLPAFRNPEIYSAMGINQNSNAGFHARELKGRGIGLVANRTIKQGEWLMSFTPAFMMSYEAYDDLSEKERIYFQRLAFERLPDRVRGLAYQLYGQSEEKAIDSIDDILDTNTFDLPVDLTSWSQGIEDNDGQADEEEEDEDDENDEEVNFKFLFPEIARFNHACRPSADYFFDSSLLTQHIVAHRNIFPGEELTITYIDPLQRHRARQKALRRSWGFTCDCSICDAPSEAIKASDARIEKILEIRDELEDTSAESGGSPLLAEQMVHLMQQERLWTLMRGGYAAAAVEHAGVGDARRAQEYAHLALQKGHVCRGAWQHDDEHRRLLQLFKNPRAHKSWRFRLRSQLE